MLRWPFMRTSAGVSFVGERETCLDPLPSLLIEPAEVPAPAERAREFQEEISFLVVPCPAEGHSDVFVLPVERLENVLSLISAAALERSKANSRKWRACRALIPSPSPDSCSFSRAYSRMTSSIEKRTPCGISSRRRSSSPQRCDPVQDVEAGEWLTRHFRGGLQREASGENAEDGEEFLFLRGKEAISPVDGPAHGLLPLGKVPGAARQQLELARQAGE